MMRIEEKLKQLLRTKYDKEADIPDSPVPVENPTTDFGGKDFRYPRTVFKATVLKAPCKLVPINANMKPILFGTQNAIK